jgi:hypothetical protein
MGLKDTIVRKLAFRYLRGKYKDLRGKDRNTNMGKILDVVLKVKKALEGWKLVIGVAIYFGSKVYDAYHNGHTGDIVGSVLTVLNWMPSAEALSGLPSATGVAAAIGSAIALVGVFGKLIRAQKQLNAGAKPSELLSPEGYVKQIVSDSWKDSDIKPSGVSS